MATLTTINALDNAFFPVAFFPVNWERFFRSDRNKCELFHYLAESVTAIQFPGVEVITTSGIDVLSTSPIETGGLTPCKREEADTRIFIHIKHFLVTDL